MFERPTNLSIATDNAGTAHFDMKAVEPKVHCPFETRPGQVPRKIEIERKKRIYNSHNIEELLSDRGLDYNDSEFSDPNSDVNLLPLDAFDNTDFECRSVAAWLALGTNAEGKISLPAKALGTSPSNGLKLFLPCCVTGVEHLSEGSDSAASGGGDTEESSNILWKVTFEEGGTAVSLHRLYVCFTAEDPVNFADRLADAHKRRKIANNEIVRQIYADCMPREEMKQLDTEQIGRISSCALATRNFKNARVDTKAILNEINTVFMRTMNR